MSIHVAIRHITHYKFDRPVALSPHVVRLKPAAHSRTPIQSYSLKVKPEKHFINWQQDPFGNYLAGIRYRAWQPPSALHPGGRNYEYFPVNAYEAEARRHIRFRADGHTIGSYTPPPWVNALDLRRR